jgi:hypothetical protein
MSSLISALFLRWNAQVGGDQSQYDPADQVAGALAPARPPAAGSSSAKTTSSCTALANPMGSGSHSTSSRQWKSGAERLNGSTATSRSSSSDIPASGCLSPPWAGWACLASSPICSRGSGPSGRRGRALPLLFRSGVARPRRPGGSSRRGRPSTSSVGPRATPCLRQRARGRLLLRRRQCNRARRRALAKPASAERGRALARDSRRPTAARRGAIRLDADELTNSRQPLSSAGSRQNPRPTPIRPRA